MLLWLYFRVLKLFYSSFYYYFFPLIVIIITYLSPISKNCETEYEFGDDNYCGSEPDPTAIADRMRFWYE